MLFVSLDLINIKQFNFDLYFYSDTLCFACEDALALPLHGLLRTARRWLQQVIRNQTFVCTITNTNRPHHIRADIELMHAHKLADDSLLLRQLQTDGG
jgi:hypothetical protein